MGGAGHDLLSVRRSEGSTQSLLSTASPAAPAPGHGKQVPTAGGHAGPGAGWADTEAGPRAPRTPRAP